MGTNPALRMAAHSERHTKQIIEVKADPTVTTADLNGDGQISLKELVDFVGPRVTREAAKANRAQHPLCPDRRHTAYLSGHLESSRLAPW